MTIQFDKAFHLKIKYSPKLEYYNPIFDKLQETSINFDESLHLNLNNILTVYPLISSLKIKDRFFYSGFYASGSFVYGTATCEFSNDLGDAWEYRHFFHCLLFPIAEEFENCKCIFNIHENVNNYSLYDWNNCHKPTEEHVIENYKTNFLAQWKIYADFS